MNILFITEDHTFKNYGITTVVSQLADEITKWNHDNRVTIAIMGRDSVQQNEDVFIEIINPSRVGAFWGWGPDLLDRLNNIIVEYRVNLIHIHGIWMAAQWAALTVAKNRNIPCIVSSHGMLEPWLWNKQSLLRKYKKKIYFNLVIKPAIGQNTVFHAITPVEKENLQRLFPIQKTVVIPNAINASKESNPISGDDILVLKKTLLFLGRLHPKKGVDLLIQAFFRAKLSSEWRLVIAGPEAVPQYTEKIKACVLNLGMSERVEFIGPVFGDKKIELLRNSWVMVTPSYSEVIGMVNLEAAACKLPSITTYETGLWDWEEGGGLLIHPDVNELTESILKVSRWSLDDRLEYGKRSRSLVVKKYSWDIVVPQWESLYSSLVLDHGILG